MEDYDYKGYRIYVTDEGYFQIGDSEFPTLEEAMDWVDSQEESDILDEPKVHKYIFFYVDRKTDRSFEVCIEAESYKEAERRLRREYDVYMIAGYYRID